MTRRDCQMTDAEIAVIEARWKAALDKDYDKCDVAILIAWIREIAPPKWRRLDELAALDKPPGLEDGKEPSHDKTEESRQPPIAGKECSKCRAVLPLDRFHLCSRTKDGRQNYCKRCVSRYKRPSENLASKHKICSRCEELLPVDQFYGSRTSEDGFFDMCKGCCITHEPKPRSRQHYETYMSGGIDSGVRHRRQDS